MYTKEELYPVIKKIWETSEHPNVKDDFDTVWEIREKYFPFKNEYSSDFKSVFFKGVELKYITNKKKLMEKLEDVPDDAMFNFDADCDGEVTLDIYIHEPMTIEMVARQIHNTLHSWACTSAYAIYKRMDALEKENEELKKKLKEKPFGNGKLLTDEEPIDSQYARLTKLC